MATAEVLLLQVSSEAGNRRRVCGDTWRRRARDRSSGRTDRRTAADHSGAGVVKSDILAHRLAHLIVNGADPRRILLMTVLRRAPRKWRGACRASAGRSSVTRRRHDPRACRTGTFHGIGARLLRMCAEQIGLGVDPRLRTVRAARTQCSFVVGFEHLTR